jgi:O-succinylbenzoic acid--CoA ligase
MTIVRAVVGGRSYLAVSPDLSDLPDSDGYLSVVPAQLHRCLDDPILTGQLSGFQAVLVGGARLDEGLQARAIAAGVRVIATYGMSETCGGVVYDGLPLPGVTINLDDDSRIGLTTPTLFDGYVGEPDLSAAVRQGSTFYTNDRGVLVEGRLHVLGRIDEVVKSGGVSVDLAGLQGLADQFFGDQVAVFAVPDPIWGSRIVVASTGPSWPTINDSLAEIVDSAARPRGFLALDRLPRLASGKIDRTSLTERWRNNGELD